MVVISLLLLLLAPLGCDRKVAGGSTDGATVYDEACARCHGPNGVPEPGLAAQMGVKDLTRRELHERLSDADIRKQILHGSANKRMPAFSGMLTDEQVDALVTYVRQLAAE
jgi:mono/diheme cytochrome c family protein